MTMGTYTGEVQFVIRDIDTGEVKEEFRSFNAARDYLKGMNFGLSQFYEIYSIRDKEVILRVEKDLTNKGYKDLRHIKPTYRKKKEVKK